MLCEGGARVAVEEESVDHQAGLVGEVKEAEGFRRLDLVIERSGAAGLHMVVEVNMTAESRSLSKCHRANKVRSDTYMESL
jgi:hypothetical protein